jgi:hypothetical protein
MNQVRGNGRSNENYKNERFQSMLRKTINPYDEENMRN